MFVFYGKHGPKDQVEYQYKETVYFRDRIGVAHEPLTKEYLLNMGYTLIGEIEDLAQLPVFVKAYYEKEASSKITTPIQNVQPVTPKVDVDPLPNPDPMSERLPNTEGNQKQWWS